MVKRQRRTVIHGNKWKLDMEGVCGGREKGGRSPISYKMCFKACRTQISNKKFHQIRRPNFWGGAGGQQRLGQCPNFCSFYLLKASLSIGILTRQFFSSCYFFRVGVYICDSFTINLPILLNLQITSTSLHSILHTITITIPMCTHTVLRLWLHTVYIPVCHAWLGVLAGTSLYSHGTGWYIDSVSLSGNIYVESNHLPCPHSFLGLFFPGWRSNLICKTKSWKGCKYIFEWPTDQ